MRRLPLLSFALLSVMQLLACPANRQVANDPDPDAGEPAGRDPMFVEREPGEQEPGRMPSVLAPEVVALYRCWFREPYAYMFNSYYGGPAFEIQDRSYGMLMAGTSGVLYYGGLSPCASEQTGIRHRAWGDHQALGDFAGVPTRNPNSSIAQFTPVNPEFVLWARKSLLADPELLIDGRRVQDAYDRVFQRFFRLMLLSAVALVERTGSVEGLANEGVVYLADTDAGAYGIDWLEQRYYGLVPSYPEAQDGSIMTAGMAAGFWLRRQIDGSLASCWHGAVEVVQLYDPYWLAEQRGAHGAAFDQLDALVDPAGASVK